MYLYICICVCISVVYLCRWVCALVYFPAITYIYACMTNKELAYTGDNEAKVDKKASSDDVTAGEACV